MQEFLPFTTAVCSDAPVDTGVRKCCSELFRDSQQLSVQSVREPRTQVYRELTWQTKERQVLLAVVGGLSSETFTSTFSETTPRNCWFGPSHIRSSVKLTLKTSDANIAQNLFASSYFYALIKILQPWPLINQLGYQSKSDVPQMDQGTVLFLDFHCEQTTRHVVTCKTETRRKARQMHLSLSSGTFLPGPITQCC